MGSGDKERRRKRRSLAADLDLKKTGSPLLIKKQKTGKGSIVLERRARMFLRSKRKRFAPHLETEIARRKRKRRKTGKDQIQEKIKMRNLLLELCLGESPELILAFLLGQTFRRIL